MSKFHQRSFNEQEKERVGQWDLREMENVFCFSVALIKYLSTGDGGVHDQYRLEYTKYSVSGEYKSDLRYKLINNLNERNFRFYRLNLFSSSLLRRPSPKGALKIIAKANAIAQEVLN